MMMFKRFTPILTFLKKFSNKIIFSLDKRKKLVITAFVLALGLLTVQLFAFSWHYWAIIILAALTYLLSSWSLIEGLNGVEWLTVLALPVLFTIGIGFFYFLTGL